ncbi:MAG: toxin HicA [Candidatus Daviesbacteria bacterium]|nr:toxin HicA [Candidatus Daviesbacteria bacterium]
MTKREKRVKKLFQNPKTVPFKELDWVLKDFGFKMRQPGSGSSHYVYTKGKSQISVPFRRPFVKEVYVKRIIELIGEEYEKKS